MQYTTVEKEQWLYQKPNSKYYDCGIRAALNAYMFWNGYDPKITQKLCYFRKKYGPYKGNRIGETTICEVNHLTHTLGLELIPIIPNESEMNIVLGYNLPLYCMGVSLSGKYGGHAFMIIPGWNGINVYNLPFKKINFLELTLPLYSEGKPWNVIFTIVPKKYSLKNLEVLNDRNLYKNLSQQIFNDHINK
jgi:hypothetical protein